MPYKWRFIQTSRYKWHLDMVQKFFKSHIWQHHVEELVEMIKMDTWITQFGVRTEKLRLREDHRHGLDKAGRPGTFLKSLSTQYHCIGDSLIDPQTLGHMPKVKVSPKGLICPSNGLPKCPFHVGLIIQRLHLHLHAKKHNRNQCQPLYEA